MAGKAYDDRTVVRKSIEVNKIIKFGNSSGQAAEVLNL